MEEAVFIEIKGSELLPIWRKRSSFSNDMKEVFVHIQSEEDANSSRSKGDAASLGN